MKRRSFTNRLIWSLGAGLLLPQCKAEAKSQDESTHKVTSSPEDQPLILPRRLKEGDTIGLITPGSYIPDKDLAKAEKNMLALGLRVKRGKNLRALRGFTAGTDQERLEDLHSMFADPEVDAIWCARGGYGCTRLLPYIDFSIIRKNPKILIGYSDITALTTAVFQETGLVCFHGPVAASTFTDYTRRELEAILFSFGKSRTISIAEENREKEDPLFQPMVLNPGKASGRLIGGNLSLLATMAGTPWALKTENRLLFLEDVEEKPYRIDRMLTQLKQSANLEEAAGFALGVFAGCVPEPEDRSLSLEDTIKGQFLLLSQPAVYGLSIGHISNQCTIPVGVKATLDADKKTITINEPWLKA